MGSGSCARDFVLWGARLSVGHLHRQHLDTARKTQVPFGFALPRTAVSPFQRPGLLTRGPTPEAEATASRRFAGSNRICNNSSLTSSRSASRPKP